MIELKNIQSGKEVHGQYMTPVNLAKDLLSGIELSDGLYIEPSFGTGNFIDALLSLGIEPINIIGVELYKNMVDEYKSKNSNLSLINENFYDFKYSTKKKVIFVGNLPFRTPASSLTTHKDEVKRLAKKYNIKGMREECVFFLLKLTELLQENNGGEMHLILPKIIFTNNSKFFVRFNEFLDQTYEVIGNRDVSADHFENVALDMCFVSLRLREEVSKEKREIVDEYWPHNKMFKRTYLGSVPCESIFLSVRGESKASFMDRMVTLFDSEGDIDDIRAYLAKDGIYHLKVLNGDNADLKLAKFETIKSYISEIKSKIGNICELLQCDDNYVEINHRHEIRYYFRNQAIKKCSFVYEINANPCTSLYFTGNPSKTSTDYFGYCDYDITRNSSPGACRTIPLEGIEERMTDEFKRWWIDDNGKDPADIFEYIITVSNSQWYKDMKKKYNRFYFGIPNDHIIS